MNIFYRIQEFGENKAKPLVSKMKDAAASGLGGLIFHSSSASVRNNYFLSFLFFLIKRLHY